MPNNVTGLGTTWNLPNYAGELFTSDPNQTPLLSMLGGLSGGKATDNFEFPTAVQFSQTDPSQPEISEMQSATAPVATHLVREQETNVVQIHQEVIDLSYVKQSNSGRISGLTTTGLTSNPTDEKAWQIEQRLKKIARDVEYSFICGEYQRSSGADVANKTRGMLELAGTVSSVNAAGATLTKAMLKDLMLQMADNGAYFNNMVMFCSSAQKQLVTELYESQLGFNISAPRNVGGVNITEIETDFCKLGIVWNRFMPSDSLLVADIAHMAPVFQAVPGKGVLFEEPLAKVGASDRIQIYGQIGLAHGPAFLHGCITGLKAD